MTRKLTLLLSLFLALLAAGPAAAYNYIYDCRGGVTWSNNDVTFYPSLTSFPVGSGWNASVESMRTAWNDNAPGGSYRIHYLWIPTTTSNNNDGKNSILIPAPADWPWPSNYIAVTTTRRSMCYIWPGPRANLAEADMAFNPYLTFDNSTNPTPPTSYGPINSTLVGIHEHGHAFGLAHEDSLFATMNSVYPDGGVIGTRNDVHPHADDVRGDRAAYGTAAGTVDLDSTAYYRTGSGTSDPIPAPASTNRNVPVSFQFTIENRGTVTINSIPVNFYLSPTRQVSTSSFYLGTASFTLTAGTSLTNTATVTIPGNAPTGYQYLGWIIDPSNTIYESDEGNNGVALTQPTYISAAAAPTACFTANPPDGDAPLYVAFDASCSNDPSGGTLTYSWNFGDGTTASGVAPHHTFDAGNWPVKLTVTSTSGASATTQQTIYVICTDPSCPQ